MLVSLTSPFSLSLHCMWHNDELRTSHLFHQDDHDDNHDAKSICSDISAVSTYSCGGKLFLCSLFSVSSALLFTLCPLLCASSLGHPLVFSHWRVRALSLCSVLLSLPSLWEVWSQIDSATTVVQTEGHVGDLLLRSLSQAIQQKCVFCLQQRLGLKHTLKGVLMCEGEFYANADEPAIAGVWRILLIPTHIVSNELDFDLTHGPVGRPWTLSRTHLLLRKWVRFLVSWLELIYYL